MEEKKYPEIKDWGLGTYVIDVKPKPEFEDGKPVDGSHKKGTSKFGNWYMYSHKHEDGTWYNIFAKDDNKHLFDSGKVEVVIRPRKDRDGEEVYKKNEEGKFVPELSVFYNEVKGEPGVKVPEPTQEESIESGEVPEDMPF